MMSYESIQLEITNPIWLYDGEEEFDENMALAELFAREIVMVGGFIQSDSDDSIADVMVLANDVWMWACADYEPLPMNQIENLYRMYRENPKWGSVWWCCKQRNMQPQAPMKRDMIKEGAYPDWMYDLNKNPDEKRFTGLL